MRATIARMKGLKHPLNGVMAYDRSRFQNRCEALWLAQHVIWSR